jgi:hypothetical protein
MQVHTHRRAFDGDARKDAKPQARAVVVDDHTVTQTTVVVVVVVVIVAVFVVIVTVVIVVVRGPAGARSAAALPGAPDLGAAVRRAVFVSGWCGRRVGWWRRLW